jgi:hypothetical protein
VLRAPSPEPSLGTLNSPYFAAALVLIKVQNLWKFKGQKKVM